MRPIADLIKQLGSKSKASEYLGVTRDTVNKYAKDNQCQYHHVIEHDDRQWLFTRRGH